MPCLGREQSPRTRVRYGNFRLVRQLIEVVLSHARMGCLLEVLEICKPLVLLQLLRRSRDLESDWIEPRRAGRSGSAGSHFSVESL